MVNFTEDNEKLLDLYLQNVQTACDLVDTIKEVVKTFDNKVFNSKVKNKVEEIINAGKPSTENIYFYITLNETNLEIELAFFNHRSFAGRDCWVYLPHDYERLQLIPYTRSEYNQYYKEKNGNFYQRQNDCYFYIDGKNLRINADYICERLDEGRKQLQEQVKIIERDRARVVEYETKRQELVEQLRALQNTFSYTVKAMYNLKDYDTYI